MERDKVTKDISRKPTGVLYLDRNRAFFYEEGLAGPLSFDLPPEILSDLEAINNKKLDGAIRGFVSANNLVPSNVIILLSNAVTFEKDFAAGGVDIDKGIEEFLELVPFEDYISKKSQSGGKVKIVAANREVCDGIKNSFHSLGFVVTEVIPLSFCIDILPQLATNLDLGLIIEKAAEFREFNLLPEVESSTSSSPETEKQTNKKQLYMLIGVFGFLGIILLFVIYKNIIAPPKTPKTLPTIVAPPPTAAPVREASPSAQISPSEAFSSKSANTQNLNGNQ